MNLTGVCIIVSVSGAVLRHDRGTYNFDGEGPEALERNSAKTIRALFLEATDILSAPFGQLRLFRSLFTMAF